MSNNSNLLIIGAAAAASIGIFMYSKSQERQTRQNIDQLFDAVTSISAPIIPTVTNTTSSTIAQDGIKHSGIQYSPTIVPTSISKPSIVTPVVKPSVTIIEAPKPPPSRSIITPSYMSIDIFAGMTQTAKKEWQRQLIADAAAKGNIIPEDFFDKQDQFRADQQLATQRRLAEYNAKVQAESIAAFAKLSSGLKSMS